jgi:hypothetical protein
MGVSVGSSGRAGVWVGKVSGSAVGVVIGAGAGLHPASPKHARMSHSRAMYPLDNLERSIEGYDITIKATSMDGTNRGSRIWIILP